MTQANGESKLNIVRAIIPREDDPDLHIVDKNNEHPSIAGEYRCSPEDLLHKLGPKVGYRALSVEEQLDRTDFDTHNVTKLLAKAVPRSVFPPEPYRWGHPDQEG